MIEGSSYFLLSRQLSLSVHPTSLIVISPLIVGRADGQSELAATWPQALNAIVPKTLANVFLFPHRLQMENVLLMFRFVRYVV